MEVLQGVCIQNFFGIKTSFSVLICSTGEGALQALRGSSVGLGTDIGQ